MKRSNVYEDLEFPDAQEMLLKAELAYRILQEIRARELTQTEAAKLMGIPQPTVSDIIRGQFHGMSIGRLMGYLRVLDPGFRVVLTPGRGARKPAPRGAAGTQPAKEPSARPKGKRGSSDAA